MTTFVLVYFVHTADCTFVPFWYILCTLLTAHCKLSLLEQSKNEYVKKRFCKMQFHQYFQDNYSNPVLNHDYKIITKLIKSLQKKHIIMFIFSFTCETLTSHHICIFRFLFRSIQIISYIILNVLTFYLYLFNHRKV